MQDFTGKVAFVTGASSGIGQATARRLAAHGATVIAVARRAERLDVLRAEFANIVPAVCDVTDHAALADLVEATVQQLGQIDALVSNAGFSYYERLTETSLDHWRETMAVNVESMFVLAKLVAPHMIERRYGRIVTIGSLSSFVGLHEVAAYVASKSGVAGLTRALAVEWAPHNVTVNAIVPGLFRTDLNAALLDSPRGQEFLVRTPMKRFGQQKELIGAAIFLSSEAASFVTGHMLAVDGGFLASGVNQ